MDYYERQAKRQERRLAEHAKREKYAELPEYQLQIFNGKTYDPVQDGDDGKHLADCGRLARVKGWRIVRPFNERPLKPKAPRRPGGYTDWRGRDNRIVEAYMTWAVSKGLKRVTVYAGSQAPHAAEAAGLAYVEVDPADFIGPVTEEADEAAAA